MARPNRDLESPAADHPQCRVGVHIATRARRTKPLTHARHCHLEHPHAQGDVSAGHRPVTARDPHDHRVDRRRAVRTNLHRYAIPTPPNLLSDQARLAWSYGGCNARNGRYRTRVPYRCRARNGRRAKRRRQRDRDHETPGKMHTRRLLDARPSRMSNGPNIAAENPQLGSNRRPGVRSHLPVWGVQGRAAVRTSAHQRKRKGDPQTLGDRFAEPGNSERPAPRSRVRPPRRRVIAGRWREPHPRHRPTGITRGVRPG